MFAPLGRGHFDLPFASFAIGSNDIDTATFDLIEQGSTDIL